MDATTDPVEALRDRLAIEEVLVRYCDAIDGRDFALLGRVFTPDAVLDYTASGGPRGRLPEVRDWLERALAPFELIQHVIGNLRVELDGDRARSRCYFTNPMGVPGRGRGMNFLCGGIYRDVLVRTPEGWRIAERVNEELYRQVFPPAEG
ncbi:MAG: nuclear transport factor 2 family protein [Myxococcota bacterium]|nr:nuclear transport factor 2 family protein [Myxococcota bacterium]